MLNTTETEVIRLEKWVAYQRNCRLASFYATGESEAREMAAEHLNRPGRQEMYLGWKVTGSVVVQER